jgi:hypothetical protein
MSSPEFTCSELGTLRQCGKFRPCDLRVNASTESTVRASNNVFAPDCFGKANNSIGYKFRMLEKVSCVTDDTWDQKPPFRELGVLPDLPLVLMTHIARLHRVGLRLYFDQKIDHCLKRNVATMRTVPAAPADMEANTIFWNTSQGVVHGPQPEIRPISDSRADRR